MKRNLAILLAVGATALLLAWLATRPGGCQNRPAEATTPPPPGPTIEKAAERAAAAIRHIRPEPQPVRNPDANGPAVYLQAEIIRPGDSSAPAPAPEHTRPSARGYPWMVLFDAPVQPQWRTALEVAGATIRAYLPDNAWLIEAPAESIDAIRRLPAVAWTGEYRPAHKLQTRLAVLARQEPALHVPFTLQTFSPHDVSDLVQSLETLGASDIRATPARRWGLIRAVLPAGKVARLAHLPEVQWLELYAPPRLLNNVSRSDERLQIESVHQLHGLDGSGQIVAIADSGLDTGNFDTIHPDFSGQILQVFDTGRLTNWSDTYYHGTHVAASLLGTGAASGGQYRGTAPGAGLVFQSVMRANNTLNIPDDLHDLFWPAYEAGARIHSDSWGSAVYGEYTSDSMTTDEFVWDHPDMLVVVAAGNDGEDLDRNGVIDLVSLNAPATAKNALSVGASEIGRPPGSGGRSSSTYGSVWGFDYRVPPISTDYISSSPSDHPLGMAAYSSRGPTLDGRLKPDIVAPGTDVISARSRASSYTAWGVLSGNTNYCFMGGTSMATPLMAGAATLVRQHLVDNLNRSSPSAALLKAALTGGARSLSPGQYGTDQHREIPDQRPNHVEGWGMADVAGTLFPGGPIQPVLMESPAPLHTGQRFSLDFHVHGGAPLNTLLAYSDYPSSLAAAIHLVNDLDLVLIDPDGVQYHPNGLNAPDRLNNLEGIDVPDPAPGRWTLEVSAHNVPQGPQPYALYLRGPLAMPVTIEHQPLDNTIVTNGHYLVEATIHSAAPVDPDSVHLYWNPTGSTQVFAKTTMTTTNGRDFSATIKAYPAGKRIQYYIAAGPPELPAFHPPNAPAQVHAFEITRPVLLTVSGSPAQTGNADPPYGTHLLPSNVSVRVRALFPPLGSNGYRTASIGWIGTGSVPSSGPADFCDFVLTRDSTITWRWQDQVALTQVSAPYGAMNHTTWHPLDGTASSLIAPESHTFNKVALTFAGWQIDGVRFPPPPAPSPRQVHGIPMPAPRTAAATYLDTTLDTDHNGLPDWFELRHYGQLGQDRLADPDGDGFENELEAADHTDPFDPDSFPEPPVIVHAPLPSPAHTPAPWPIEADITDNYQVAAATLHWRRNDGPWRTTPMTNAPGSSRYSGTIPSPARDGDAIAYFLSAVDPAGFLAQSDTWTVQVAYPRITLDPPAFELAAPSGLVTNLYLHIQNPAHLPLEVELDVIPIGFWDDVESGTNHWSRPDGNLDWNISAQESHSPEHAWYCGQELTRTYRNSTHAALVSPPIQLAADSPRLDFMHWARFEPDHDYFPDGVHYWDSGVIEISDNDGLTWQFLVPEGGYPGLITSNPASPFAPDTPCFIDTDGWESVGADLSDYAGREVRIRFRFGADRYVVAEGWRIDDIEVSPRTLHEDWLTLSESSLVVPPETAAALPIHLDTGALPPMASGHLAIRVRHNDPERPGPILIPVALHNTTRSVQITTSGDGTATPQGQLYLQAGEPLALDLDAHSGAFIADIRRNAEPVPLPHHVVTRISLYWPQLDENTHIHTTFAPLLPDGSVSLDWLATYGLTSRHWMAEASLDHDGDGLLTWQEEQLGSSPIDPDDAPLVVRLLPPDSPGAAWRITWHAYTNLDRSYSILTAPNLADGFTPWTHIPPSPPVMTSPPLLPSHHFFGLQRP